ncbi:hypothetical protein TYRP_002478 [Tyrophagus putrescentiae]|nr:hypothetical protein TYRP_002478 [Tyrophagus putrescentiae]
MIQKMSVNQTDRTLVGAEAGVIADGGEEAAEAEASFDVFGNPEKEGDYHPLLSSPHQDYHLPLGHHVGDLLHGQRLRMTPAGDQRTDRLLDAPRLIHGGQSVSGHHLQQLFGIRSG